MGFFSAILDFVFPKNCIFCAQPIHNKDIVCLDCLTALPFCGGEDAISGESFSSCRALLFYEGSVRGAIQRYKYRGQYGDARVWGRLLGRMLSRAQPEFDVMTYVPQSLSRGFERKFDHARLLAIETAKTMGRARPQKLLHKAHATSHQVGLSAKDRSQNLKGSFLRVKVVDFTGKRVLLLDDVLTTGATLEECAAVLKQNGAKEVFCAVLARTADKHNA